MPKYQRPSLAPLAMFATDKLRAVLDALVRMNGSLSPEVRQRQIQQFQTGQGLPPTTERPTALTKFQQQPYVSQREYLPRVIQLPSSVVGMPIDQIRGPIKLTDEPMVIRGGEKGGIGSPRLTHYLGLGDATVSIGRDERGPYLSVFDSWDFEKDPLGMVARGQPFNVYDRIYFQPDDRGRIPQFVTHPNRGDINLKP